MSHTPGPWLCCGWSVIEKKSNIVISDVAGGSLESAANAKLISAAPDMLEALERIIAVVRSGGTLYKGQEEYVTAIDAIKKAGGTK